MSELKLWEISDAFSELEKNLEDDLSLQEYLDAVKMDLVEKTDQILMVMRGSKLTSEAISSEIDRLIHLKKYYDNKEAKLKSYLAYNMHKIGKDRLETEKAVLSFRKSTSTEILDATLIPNEYITIKQVESIDKVAIKKDILAGKTVQGAIIKEVNNLQIK